MMAITPEQASQLTPEEMGEIAKSEASIDAKLALHYQNDASVICITYNIAHLLSQRAREVLFDRYVKAGWQVIKDKDGESDTFRLKAYRG